MLRHFFILIYLALTPHFCSTTNTDNNDLEKEQQIVPTRYLRVQNFFENGNLWEPNTSFLNPHSFRQVIASFPELPLYNFPPRDIVQRILAEILFNKNVLDDLVKVSNSVLSVYSFKAPSIGSLSLGYNCFNTLDSFDIDIIREAITSFTSIICTPDPYRTRGYEWKMQTFVRSFDLLWTKLNGSENDIILNCKLRREVALAVGLLPFLQPSTVINHLYPHLAKYLKRRISKTSNISKKPIYTVFMLSLMNALTAKVHQEELRLILEFSDQMHAQNTAPQLYQEPSVIERKGSSHKFPNRLEEAKRKSISNRGRRNSLEFDANGKLVDRRKAKSRFIDNRDDSSSDEEDGDIDFENFSFLPPAIVVLNPESAKDAVSDWQE